MLTYHSLGPRYAIASRQTVRDFRFDLAEIKGLKTIKDFLAFASLDPPKSDQLTLVPSTDSDELSCEPGFLVSKETADAANEILQTYTAVGKDSLRVHELLQGDWAKYRYMGPYENLGQAWESATTTIENDGRKSDSKNRIPFQLYANGDLGSETTDNVPIVEIWIPVV
ncbi:hypothetical protein HK098_006308 [Nowakowskiella sp. JEL0407]|nr:hypothetical protein HK098_006308 [Nowakowskiella sp. JEL0407]